MKVRAVICACCGNQTAQSESDDIPMREAPDFDTRPGKPLRSTISSWVSRCGTCSFCSADLTHIHEGGPLAVRSPEYQSLLRNESLNSKAREFRCYSYVLEHAGLFADSGWSALHAAWTCDDVGDIAGSIDCRMQAIALWRRGKESGENFSEDLASEYALAADVYRRAGQFEHAVIAVSEGLDLDDLDPTMEVMLRKQKSFVEARDANRHFLED